MDEKRLLRINMKFCYWTILTMLSEVISEEYTTIMSPSEAIAEFNRKVKLYEEGKPESDSDPEVSTDNISQASEFNEMVSIKRTPRTTLNPLLVTKVRKPKGYFKKVLADEEAKHPQRNVKTKENIQTDKIIKVTEQTIRTSELMKKTTEQTIETEYRNRITTRHPSRNKDKTHITPWRITPYPNYDSVWERKLQKKIPGRKEVMDNRIQYYYDQMFNISHSYSEESVPSSCDCFSGNWSQSYDAREMWNKKQCKPIQLERDYMESSQQFNPSKPIFTDSDRKKKKKKHKKETSEEESSYSRPRYRHKRRRNNYPYRRIYHQPMPYPVYNVQPLAYPPYPHMAYPYPYPQYPPPIFPYHPPPAYPHPQDELAHKKIKELQKELNHMKSTTLSLWEQYLQLKEKFETTVEITQTSNAERMQNYRKVEKMEPFHSKFKNGAAELERNNPDDFLWSTRRLYQNEQSSCRPYRSINYERLTREYNLLNEYRRYNRYDLWPRGQESTRPVIRGLADMDTLVPTSRITYVRRYTSARPNLRYSDIRWGSAKDTIITTITEPPKTTQTTSTTCQTETTNIYEAFKAYKEKYEFPDYVAEKRRLLREEEKKKKRILYAARGMVYDEGNITRFTTTSPFLYTDLFLDYRDVPDLLGKKLLKEDDELLFQRMGDHHFAFPQERFNYYPFEIRSYMKKK